jgi:hypothetical protein
MCSLAKKKNQNRKLLHSIKQCAHALSLTWKRKKQGRKHFKIKEGLLSENR